VTNTIPESGGRPGQWNLQILCWNLRRPIVFSLWHRVDSHFFSIIRRQFLRRQVCQGCV
jgi:hypothetical protein